MRTSTTADKTTEVDDEKGESGTAKENSEENEEQSEDAHMSETEEDSGNDLCKAFEGDPLKDFPANQR